MTKRDNSGKRQIHICEVSLRWRRETSRRRRKFEKKRLWANTYLGSLTSLTKRDFWGEGENSRKKDFGQIHICEVSLRRRRETSEAKRIRERRETSETERLHKNILCKLDLFITAFII